MKNVVLLTLILLLSACGGGSSGGGNGLSPAENLFGAGIGTGQVPTHLVPREDGAGFEILSFGAWGNVYDIKRTSENSINLNGWQYGTHTISSDEPLFDFLGQQKLNIQDNYRFAKDASVANSTFVGSAIMYTTDPSQHLTDSDYGSMKLQFGQDIDNIRLEFVMNNPENNITVTSNDNVNLRFTGDRQDVAVGYWTLSGNDPIYVGYGTKK